jgi:predicted permease
MISDLRYALRALRHNRSFAVVAILSIAFGIGANSVIFSLADAVLLRPLPIPNPARVVNLRSQFRGQAPGKMSYPDFVDFRGKTRTFEGITAYRLNQFGFAPDKRVLPEMKAGFLVSGNFFDVLQVRPQLGRGFRPEEDAVPGRDAVTVISHDLWRDEFASSPDVIGRSVFVNGIDFKIVGVMPESFPGIDQYFRPALYIPLMMNARLAGDPAQNWLQDRKDRRLDVKGRLKAGASAEAAGAEARVIAGGLAQAYPEADRNWSAAVRTEMQARVDNSPWDAILVGLLLGLSGIVLVIACANVANLMLGRGLMRSAEIAIRMAVGANRWQLVRQLMTEALVISLAAAGAGLLLAQACMDTFLPWRIPSEIPIEISARLDYRGLIFSLCAAVASAVVCGLVPALRATGFQIEPALRAGARNMEPRRRYLGRNALVIAQVAGSLFLLVCAAQFYRGIAFLMTTTPGFRSDHILMAGFDPTLARKSDAQAQDFYKQLIEKARRLPGVESAAVTELMPLADHTDMRPVVPEGFRLPPGSESVSTLTDTVSEDYFATLDIPVIRGRGFQTTDTAESPRVAVVNERFASAYFPGRDPLGRRFRLGGPKGDWVEIVGVARMSKYQILFEPPVDFVYLPLSQNPRAGMMILLHTAAPSQTLATPLRDLVKSIDSDQPIFALRTIEQYIRDRSTKTMNVLAGMVGGMGLLGLVLALSGLYAVMGWSVARRSREFGIRMAVGADSISVLGMVLKQGVRLSGIGIAIGLALSLVFSRALTAGMGLPSFNVPVLILVPVALTGMALLGAYVPARRASQLDPITVLKEE